MPIMRIVVDVATDDAIDNRKIAAITQDARDYIRGVLLKNYEVTIDKDWHGEGVPRWAHWHDSRGSIESGAACEPCMILAQDELSKPGPGQ